ncbi:N-methyl-L-tryptophan oxidase [Convivina intestini]|uniref:N-methyl-L-tryptophan oxidase n=1 Tax=Convivina intestini TaxID=1505726 RepID=UPI00200BAB22|nr:N-methyl-L-tryptophan oxidase [Convivina intestini]CAH1857200.1 N-methyl-L-tryptophan oxidase [Convivina intestini]
MQKIYDLAIIGTGSVGSAAGYYASRDGLSVLELDLNRPPHDQGSHHGQTRIIRHAYGEGDQYVPLVLRAQELWNQLQQNSHQDIFHQTGVLNIAPKHSNFLKNIKKSADSYQLNVDYLSPSQIHKRWPDWHFNDDYAGIFENNGGYLLSENIIESYLQGAANYGAKQDFSAKVLSLKHLSPDLIEIQTSKTTYLAQQVAVTAGTWVKELLPQLPIKPVRKVFSWFNINDVRLEESAGFPCFTVTTTTDQIYYGFPGQNHQIKIGRHNGGQAIEQRSERLAFGNYPDDASEINPLLAEHLQGTTGLNHGGACSYDLSPDENFIIDWLPGKSNIQVVTGLSGHGFKFASVLGEIIAQRAQRQQIHFDLSPFSLQRFN